MAALHIASDFDEGVAGDDTGPDEGGAVSGAVEAFAAAPTVRAAAKAVEASRFMAGDSKWVVPPATSRGPGS
jgi:hypothetical protein